VARLRLVIVPALLAICLCAYSTAFAGGNLSPRASGSPIARAAAKRTIRANRTERTRRAKRKNAKYRRAHHATPCAKRSSFHARGGHPRHRRRHVSCLKRRGGHHATGIHRGRSRRHSRAVRPHHLARRHISTHSIPTAANSDTCPNANLKPDQNNVESIRAATLCLINRERVGHGENPLQPNRQLQRAAQSHTEDMAFGDYFEHVGSKGDTPLDRMRAAGYIYSSQIGYEVGENIGWGTLWLATPRAIVAAWMASPGHRANILDAHFRDTAIGVSPHPPASLAQGQPGGLYTQDFGVIITG